MAAALFFIRLECACGIPPFANETVMQSRRHSCVVLGGGGFLGLNLCRRLMASGHRVRAFGHRGLFPAELGGADLLQGDFSDRAAITSAIQGAEVAFHLIHSTVPNSANLDMAADVRQNLLPSLAFFDLARSAGVKRVVFLSSGGTIYGHPMQIPTEETAPTEPITAYGISKLAIEKYLALYQRLYGLDYRILRVANPFGPFQVAVKGQGLIAEIIWRAMNRERIEVWGDGSIVRDFIFVDDVIDAVEIAACDGSDERIFNIGSGTGRSIRQVLAAIEHSLPSKLDIAWKGERAVDVPVSILSVTRARDKLGWAPKTSFESGIVKTIAWWKDNADLVKKAMMARISQDGVQSRAD
jgi:UDP-glucose 4-epimerase